MARVASIVLAALTLLVAIRPSIDLTFVRHGETVANATGLYNSRTLDAFSAKGEAEVAALTKSLRSQRFDLILVSPSPRALHTIRPYLEATGQRATVWPLLYECCTGRRPRGAHPTRFVWGGQIRLSAQDRRVFRIDPAESRLPAPSDYDGGLAQVQACVAEFRTRCAGKRVLLVGHSGHGGQFFFALTGKRFQVKNADPMRFLIR